MDGRKKMLMIGSALLATLGLFGCSGKKSHSESNLTFAYRLIDAHKDDEAIAYLEGQCPDDSDDVSCRVALASAFAHKADIKIQRFVPIITTTKNIGSLNLEFDSSQVDGEVSAKIDGSASHVASLLGKFAGILNVYTVIPTIKDEDAPFLEQAIRIMETLPRRVR